MLTNKELTELLRANGYKVTPQRIAVYNALCHRKDHPTVEMIFNTLEPYYPTMSLATVYKSVDILVKIGVVNMLNTGEESFRYDAQIDTHTHICCTKCGTVSDIIYDTAGMLEEIKKQTNVEIEKYQMYFYGVCNECKLEKEKAM